MTNFDYHVELIQFPSGNVKETVTLNEDGSYTIFIDASLDSFAQKKAFEHAVKHITGEDFNKDDITSIERVTHNLEISKELCGGII